jgi:hypothetical protein
VVAIPAVPGFIDEQHGLDDMSGLRLAFSFTARFWSLRHRYYPLIRAIKCVKTFDVDEKNAVRLVSQG